MQTFYLTDADAKVAVNLLRTILNTRQVFVNEKLNALVVRETPEKIELARKVLEANDRSVGEVEIDLEVLEVDRTAAQNLGLDFSPRTLSVTLNFPQNIPVSGFVSVIQRGSTVSITSPTLILNLVKNDSTTKVLANPTVRILDRQKARLLIGQRRPFLISSISSVPVGHRRHGYGRRRRRTTTGAVTTTQTNVEYRDLGLKMTLTPTVHLDGEVTVEINFEISAVGPAIADVPGANLLPPVNTRNLDTFIKVRNGETRLLGGLYQEDASVANSKMPFLSEIPLLGRLFMSPNEQRSRTDVLISLTPRIVKTMNRPDADIESFTSGTADSFGPAAPACPRWGGGAASSGAAHAAAVGTTAAARARRGHPDPARGPDGSVRTDEARSGGGGGAGSPSSSCWWPWRSWGSWPGWPCRLPRSRRSERGSWSFAAACGTFARAIDQFKAEYDKARTNVRDARDVFKQEGVGGSDRVSAHAGRDGGDQDPPARPPRSDDGRRQMGRPVLLRQPRIQSVGRQGCLRHPKREQGGRPGWNDI